MEPASKRELFNNLSGLEQSLIFGGLILLAVLAFSATYLWMSRKMP